jgi:hypothetical protein
VFSSPQLLCYEQPFVNFPEKKKKEEKSEKIEVKKRESENRMTMR